MKSGSREFVNPPDEAVQKAVKSLGKSTTTGVSSTTVTVAVTTPDGTP